MEEKKSTFYSIKDAEIKLKELIEGFRYHYSEFPSTSNLVDKKTKGADNKFYKRLREDSKKVYDDSDYGGISGSWLRKFFDEKKPENRSMDNNSYDDLEKLIKFYNSKKHNENELVTTDAPDFPILRKTESLIVIIKKYKSTILIAIGFLFFFIPWIALPIASIGIYSVKNKIQPYKDIRNKRIIFALIFLLSFCSSIYGLYYLDKYIEKKVQEKVQVINAPKFDDNIFGDGHFTSIGNIEAQNVLKVSVVSKRPSMTFKVYIHYRNIGFKSIQNSRAFLDYESSGTGNTTRISSRMNAPNAFGIEDDVFLTNLPRKWKLKVLSARAINENDSKSCLGSNYSFDIINPKTLTMKNVGAPVGDLRTNKYIDDGITKECSQGFLEIEMEVSMAE